MCWTQLSKCWKMLRRKNTSVFCLRHTFSPFCWTLRTAAQLESVRLDPSGLGVWEPRGGFLLEVERKNVLRSETTWLHRFALRSPQLSVGGSLARNLRTPCFVGREIARSQDRKERTGSAKSEKNLSVGSYSISIYL